MKVHSLEEIILPLRENKQTYKDQFGVTRIGVFGSFTRAEQTQGSDIDIVVEMEEEKRNIHNFFKFKRLLESEFGCEVDLGFEDMLKPIVREKLAGKIVYV